MEYTADYLANCRRFGIAPSADDYAEYLADADANAPDDALEMED